jgi:hypothetical protein
VDMDTDTVYIDSVTDINRPCPCPYPCWMDIDTDTDMDTDKDMGVRTRTIIDNTLQLLKKTYLHYCTNIPYVEKNGEY